MAFLPSLNSSQTGEEKKNFQEKEMPITFANNAFLKFNGSKNPELLKKRENIGINTNVLLTNKQVYFKFHMYSVGSKN